MFEILRLLCPSSKYGGIQQKFKTSLGRIYRTAAALPKPAPAAKPAAASGNDEWETF
jgi:hypothetical protein